MLLGKVSMLNTMIAGELTQHKIKPNEDGYRFCRMVQGESHAYKCFSWFMRNANGRWAWQHTPWRSQNEYLIFLDDEKDIVYFELKY
jgi:hypothetical protein